VTIENIKSEITKLKALQPEIVVPAHGGPTTVQLLDETDKFYDVLLERVGKQIAQGKSLEEINENPDLPEYKSWSGGKGALGYQHRSRLPRAEEIDVNGIGLTRRGFLGRRSEPANGYKDYGRVIRSILHPRLAREHPLTEVSHAKRIDPLPSAVCHSDQTRRLQPNFPWGYKIRDSRLAFLRPDCCKPLQSRAIRHGQRVE